MLHRGEERLGDLPETWRPGENAEECVHSNAGLSSDRRSWALGAARAAGGSEQVAPSVSTPAGSTRWQTMIGTRNADWGPVQEP